MNRFKKRQLDKVESPYLDGSRIKHPFSTSEAVSMIEGHQKQIERQKHIIETLQTEEIDLYDRSCVLFMQRDYSALEEVKRAYTENQTKRLNAVDIIAYCLETIRICKTYLQEHPIECDQDGSIRLIQGRLF